MSKTNYPLVKVDFKEVENLSMKIAKKDLLFFAKETILATYSS